MKQNEKVYEPPKAIIYQFDDNDQILTASGDSTSGGNSGTQDPTPNYAAKALNDFMGGTNTTMEK